MGILAADLPEIDPVAKHEAMIDAMAAMELNISGERPVPKAAEAEHEVVEREALTEGHKRKAAEARAATAKEKLKVKAKAPRE